MASNNEEHRVSLTLLDLTFEDLEEFTDAQIVEQIFEDYGEFSYMVKCSHGLETKVHSKEVNGFHLVEMKLHLR